MGKSNRSTTQPAVTQNSNDRPNKLSRRTATRSQTRPVCNKGKGSHSFTCHPHTNHSVSTPQSQGNCPLTGTKLYWLVTGAHRCEKLAQSFYAVVPG